MVMDSITNCTQKIALKPYVAAASSKMVHELYRKVHNHFTRQWGIEGAVNVLEEAEEESLSALCF